MLLHSSLDPSHEDEFDFQPLFIFSVLFVSFTDIQLN
jgi:hypothetical protein